MKKIRKTIMLIIMILSMAGTMVQADTTNSFKVTVTPESKTIKPGEEIAITLSVSDINMGEDGINTLEGIIKYDKEIFEEVTSSSIKSQNNWVTTYNDESSTLNGKFLSVNLVEGAKEKTNIFIVTLKAKKDIEETTTTQINFNDITSNNGAQLISAGTKTVNVTIEVEEENENGGNNNINNIVNDTNEPTTNNTTNNTTNTINKTDTTTNKVNNTQSGTNLPKTGKSDIIVITIIIVGIIAIYYWKKRSYLKGI